MNRRNTKQRELVLDAVRSLQSHATADEIYEVVTQRNANISKGTVYRNLNLLADENLILKIENPMGPEHFDHTLKKHYHILCVDCKKLFDADIGVVEQLENYMCDQKGTKILSYDILFKGICLDCQKKEKN